MYLGVVDGGQNQYFDIVQDVSAVGIRIELNGDRTLDWQEIMRKVKITGEIVSSDSRQGKMLFRKVPLLVFSALLNFGSAFNQVEKVATDENLYVNVPICLTGAIAFDKQKYLRFEVESDLEDVISIHFHAIGSTVTGADPIRITYNNYQPNELTKIGLSGSSHICFERGHFDKIKYKSVIGRTLELTDDECVFVENTFGDLFIASKDGEITETLKGFIVMPTSATVSAELEVSNKTAEIWSLYQRYDDSMIDGCHC